MEDGSDHTQLNKPIRPGTSPPEHDLERELTKSVDIRRAEESERCLNNELIWNIRLMTLVLDGV